MVGIFMVLLLGLGAPVLAQGATSSPLEILKQAPKVKIEDEPVRPVQPAQPVAPPRQEPVPYIPPRGAAPPIEPVQPAFTPYSGSATIGGGRPAEPGYQATPYNQAPRRLTPTPRPVLGPEDVEEPRKKGGIVRGLFRAIPFVGGDDDDETPAQTPMATLNPPYDTTYPGAGGQGTPPIYRGYDAAEPAGPRNLDDEPLLRAPGGPLPADPTPSSPPAFTEPAEIMAPPILTPEPRMPPPIDEADQFERAETPAAGTGNPSRTPAVSGPVLTVQRETDTTDSVEETPVDAGAAATTVEPNTPAEAKTPARATETPVASPRPLERATTSVLIEESRPVVSPDEDSNIGPKPDTSAITMKPFDPAAAGTSATPAESVPAVDDVITSLSIEQADLGMPNPAYEQNTVILAAFQNAVRLARGEDHAGAARAFREYVANHPSSGLAPRAAFLAVIFERNRSQARENLSVLKTQFKDSRYVAEAEKRRGDDLKIAGAVETAATETGSVTATEVAVTNEPVPQQIARLERELTAAVGDMTREPQLRKQLGLLYLQQEETERAYEVLRPAAEMAEGQPVNGEVLIALGRTLMARGETVQAVSLYEAVEERHPGLIEGNAASAWSVGLAYEGAGKYGKARVLYNGLRQNFPATAEAGWASARLSDLAALQR